MPLLASGRAVDMGGEPANGEQAHLRCPCDSVGAKEPCASASVSHTCTRKTILQSMHDPFDLLGAKGQVEALWTETIFLVAGDKTIHRM